VNRIVAFWGKLKENGWLQNSEDLRLERMLRDLQPVVDIYDEIASTLNIRKE
jgi:hypothetical protein